MEQALIVGLGNPGDEYAATRHNVGFRVIDELVRRGGFRLRHGDGEYRIGSFSDGGRRVFCCKPMTYMNNSGAAVAEVLETLNIAPSHMLVVVDDVALPLGKIRMRAQGSDGGHNGLYSIIFRLNTMEFPRLRCGIGTEPPPSKTSLPEFVLSPFRTAEESVVAGVVTIAADAALEFARDGIARAMNKFNT